MFSFRFKINTVSRNITISSHHITTVSDIRFRSSVVWARLSTWQVVVKNDFYFVFLGTDIEKTSQYFVFFCFVLKNEWTNLDTVVAKRN